MNFQHFLNERLNFALFLYDSTVPQFEEIKRKIETEDAPYNYSRHSGDESDEPLFQAEWEQADLGVDVIGMTCLGQVQIALNTFLKEFTKRAFGQKTLDQIPLMKQKSWLANFRAFYATNPDFEWANSGADLGLLEEVILTRNDFQHNTDLLNPYTFQDDKHKEKYPDSSFRHPTWSAIFPRNARLYVTREKLDGATEAVRILAKYLEYALPIARQKALKDRAKG